MFTKQFQKPEKKNLNVVMKYNGPIKAPIQKDEIVGSLEISYKDELLEKFDLLAFESVKRLNIFSRILVSINYLIWGDV